MPTIEESITQLLSAQEAAERWTTGPLNITILQYLKQMINQ